MNLFSSTKPGREKPGFAWSDKIDGAGRSRLVSMAIVIAVLFL